jgi:hypothetical protein
MQARTEGFQLLSFLAGNIESSPTPSWTAKLETDFYQNSSLGDQQHFYLPIGKRCPGKYELP